MIAKLQKHLSLIKWLLLITLVLNSMFLGMFLWTTTHKNTKPQIQICVDSNNNIYSTNKECNLLYNY